MPPYQSLLRFCAEPLGLSGPAPHVSPSTIHPRPSSWGPPSFPLRDLHDRSLPRDHREPSVSPLGNAHLHPSSFPLGDQPFIAPPGDLREPLFSARGCTEPEAPTVRGLPLRRECLPLAQPRCPEPRRRAPNYPRRSPRPSAPHVGRPIARCQGLTSRSRDGATPARAGTPRGSGRRRAASTPGRRGLYCVSRAPRLGSLLTGLLCRRRAGGRGRGGALPGRRCGGVEAGPRAAGLRSATEGREAGSLGSVPRFQGPKVKLEVFAEVLAWGSHTPSYSVWNH